jgi:hypothetical protein
LVELENFQGGLEIALKHYGFSPVAGSYKRRILIPQQ